MLYFKLYPFTLLRQCRSLTFLLCIWVNCCSIISPVLIYLKVLKRWISILNLALFCSTLAVALLVVDLPPSHSLSLWFAQDLESFCSLQTCLRLNHCCLGLVSLGPRVALLVVVLCPSQSFMLLCCSTPRVTLLILDLSSSQSFFLCFAQHLESLCSLQTCLRFNLCRFGLLNTELICSLLTCLDSRGSLFQPFVLCVENSTRSACCSVVSGGYLNTLAFVGLFLVSSCFIHPSF